MSTGLKIRSCMGPYSRTSSIPIADPIRPSKPVGHPSKARVPAKPSTVGSEAANRPSRQQLCQPVWRSQRASCTSQGSSFLYAFFGSFAYVYHAKRAYALEGPGWHFLEAAEVSCLLAATAGRAARMRHSYACKARRCLVCPERGRACTEAGASE